MMLIDVDVVIIGVGIVGMSVYLCVKVYIVFVLLIEGGVYGMMCVWVGCMFSKLLIVVVEVVYQVCYVDCFGVRVDVVIDGVVVMVCVWCEWDCFVGFVLESIDVMLEGDCLMVKVSFQDVNILMMEQGQLICV